MRMLTLKISLLIMGLSGIIAQIVLLRELLISFLGNELTLGIILANWLILEAVGSFLIGKSVEKVKKKMEAYVFLQIFFSVALPFSIYLSRIFKTILLTTPGEGLGFVTIFYSSFLILLPVSVSHGALFTYASKLYSQYEKKDATSIGKVYVLETLGSIIGGFLITFVLVQYFDSFVMAFMISLLTPLSGAETHLPNPTPRLGHLSPLWAALPLYPLHASVGQDPLVFPPVAMERFKRDPQRKFDLREYHCHPERGPIHLFYGWRSFHHHSYS
jgi:hypothetical protein